MYIYVLIAFALSTLPIDVSANITICMKANQTQNNMQESYSFLADQLEEGLNFHLNNDDSMFIDHLDFDFKHPALTLKGELNNVTLSQYDDYNFTQFSMADVLKGEFEVFRLTFRNISFDGKYDMFGNIGDLFDIWGSGHFWATPLNFSISAKAKILSLNLTTVCFTADATVELESYEGWFDNLMDDEELQEVMNDSFKYMVPEAITVIWDETKEAIDGPLEKLLNLILNWNTNTVKIDGPK